MRRGIGPTVMLRADMDGLPIREKTGLPYASTQVVQRDGGAIPTMHACGHDMHVTAMIGAAQELAADPTWEGTIMVVFQPGEETGEGARAMINDGVFERFAKPDVVLSQHVSPLPAGFIGAHQGPAFAAADSIKMKVFGTGGHGSQPERGVDVVLLAARLITHLHTIVPREVTAFETAVLTIGEINAGSSPNVIPETATITLTLHTFNPRVRTRLLQAIERVAHGNAAAAGALRMPEMDIIQSFPMLVNDPEATAQTNLALETLPGVEVLDPGALTNSEDVGEFSTAAGVPGVYWLLGGADPRLAEDLASASSIEDLLHSHPSNHSPYYAPVIHPTLGIGICALVAAAKAWLARA
ncbi:MAG TPA: amidohydrolase, partial [Beutenbergiaceae bacterium]|nr:amidohydrolase [Beutenbergiaceae bacterium]